MKVAVKYLITLVLALLLVWAVHTYVLTIFSVPQGGLPPYLKSGSRVIVNRVYCDSFKRGDLVVFTDTIARRGASVTEAHFIGRIERLPGDTITLTRYATSFLPFAVAVVAVPTAASTLYARSEARKSFINTR